MADYGGVSLFGRAVTISMSPHPSEVQMSTFFGLSGVFSLWGGTRGRVFMAEGMLVADDYAGLDAARNAFEAMNDGVPRTLTDTWDISWDNVVFDVFTPQGRVVQLAGGGLGLAYRAQFSGRT